MRGYFIIWLRVIKSPNSAKAEPTLGGVVIVVVESDKVLKIQISFWLNIIHE